LFDVKILLLTALLKQETVDAEFLEGLPPDIRQELEEKVNADNKSHKETTKNGTGHSNFKNASKSGSNFVAPSNPSHKQPQGTLKRKLSDVWSDFSKFLDPNASHSPRLTEFEEQMEKWIESKNLESVAKFLMRMRKRATEFPKLTPMYNSLLRTTNHKIGASYCNGKLDIQPL